MNIDIASIDMVSEVNMVSRPLSPLLLGQCVTIVITVMLKPWWEMPTIGCVNVPDQISGCEFETSKPLIIVCHDTN